MVESLGATEHCPESDRQFNWKIPKILSFEQHYFRQKFRELLEIKKAKPNEIKSF